VRQAFRCAAEDALTRVPCQGEGAIYRAIAPLQRAFFDPPTDCRAGWDISFERTRASGRESKLIAGSPLEFGGDQRRARRHLKAVG
jgi:hypothetical protein